MKGSTQSIQVLCTVFIHINAGTYNYENLGANWSDVEALCGTGTAQSPINLVRQTLVHRSANNIDVSYTGQSGLKIKNSSGMTQKVSAADAATWGTQTYDSVNYKVAQYHFHAPAEHTFDGLRYDMELHFVHVEDADPVTKYLVVTVFFNIGEKNDWLVDSGFGSLSSTTDAEVSISGTINPWDMIKRANTEGYFTYGGSFTTPPCTEGVTFILLKEWQTMSQEQWDAFTTSQPNAGVTDWAYTSGKGNYRVTNAINAREVYSDPGRLNGYSSMSAGEEAGIAIGTIAAVLFFFGVPCLICYLGTRQKEAAINLQANSSANKSGQMQEYKKVNSDQQENKVETK